MPKAKLVSVDGPAPEKRTMTTLKMADNFKLIKYITEEYTTSMLSDGEFAKRATEALSIPGLNAAHISNRRVEFGILANSKVPPAQVPGMAEMASQLLTQQMQIADLTERIAMLEAWVNNTFPSKGPKPALT